MLYVYRYCHFFHLQEVEELKTPHISWVMGQKQSAGEANHSQNMLTVSLLYADNFLQAKTKLVGKILALPTSFTS